MMDNSTRGIEISSNSGGVPIFRLRFSADPRKGPDWEASERKKFTPEMWAQEYELDDNATGGERLLLPLLRARWKDIVITSPAWQADPGWAYSNGLDYGKTHRTSLHGYAMDFHGTRYAICEHYRSGLTPAQHVPEMKRLRLPFEDKEVNPLVLSKTTYYDPSMGYTNVAGEENFTSYIELFTKAGMSRLSAGIRGRDKSVAEQIEDCWNQKDPTFKIVLRPPEGGPTFTDVGSLKKMEGTYSWGCPNLLWEIANLRRVLRSAAREETKGPSEALMDKDNDAFDDLSYWWTSCTMPPQISKERRWHERKAILLGANPDMDLDSLIIQKTRFDREQNKREVLSWR